MLAFLPRCRRCNMLEIYNRKRRSLITNDTEFISSVSILTLLMFAMPPNMQAAVVVGVPGECDGVWGGWGGGVVMYGWQLESILSRFAARFDHTNHSLAICAMPEPMPPLRLMYDFGLIFVEHVRRKCMGVRMCVCGTFKICSYRYDCATHRAQVHKGDA